MGGTRRTAAFILGIVAFWAGAGCASSERCRPAAAPTPALLFGPHAFEAVATDIGRDAWPATDGRFRSVEDTYFAEYYVDIQGHASSESSYPRRTFRSLRLGVEHR